MRRDKKFADLCKNCVHNHCDKQGPCVGCDCCIEKNGDYLCYCSGAATFKEVKEGKCAQYKTLKFSGLGVLKVPQYCEAKIAERGTGKAYAFITEEDREEVEKKSSVYMRPIQDNLEEAANQLNYASLYIGYALGRAELGETKNARLLTELAERGVLRAFLYIRNALEDAKDNEKDR